MFIHFPHVFPIQKTCFPYQNPVVFAFFRGGTSGACLHVSPRQRLEQAKLAAMEEERQRAEECPAPMDLGKL